MKHLVRGLISLSVLSMFACQQESLDPLSRARKAQASAIEHPHLFSQSYAIAELALMENWSAARLHIEEFLRLTEEEPWKTKYADARELARATARRQR